MKEGNFENCLNGQKEKNNILAQFLLEKIDEFLEPQLSHLNNFDVQFPLCYEEMRLKLKEMYSVVENKYLRCVDQKEEIIM